MVEKRYYKDGSIVEEEEEEMTEERVKKILEEWIPRLGLEDEKFIIKNIDTGKETIIENKK